MDMLEIGNGGMSTIEYQTHFTIWAILKSNLILGNDVSSMSKEDLAIVSNKEVIAINQDVLGVSASLVHRQNRRFNLIADVDIWAGPLSNDRFVVMLFNRNSAEKRDIVLDIGKHLKKDNSTEFKGRFRNVWEAKDLSFHSEFVAKDVLPHQSILLVVSDIAKLSESEQKKVDKSDSEHVEL